MTREFIIRALTERGITAEATEVKKNGVLLEGIIIGDGNVKPTIYVDQYEDVDESQIDMVIENIINALDNAPQFDMTELASWDWAKTRLRLCLQKKTDELIVKRDFLDLEQYVRVIVDESDGGTSSFKVTPAMLNAYGVTEDELFHAAIDCTRPLVAVQDMAEIMAEMMEMPIEEVLEMQGDNPPMIIVTNKTKINGASAICFMDVLKEVADRYEKDLAILPSSIHECILHPVEDTTDFRAFDSMIQEVNETQVIPEEVLGNHAYRFIRDENRIVY